LRPKPSSIGIKKTKIRPTPSSKSKSRPQKGIGFDKIAHEISKFPEVSAVYLMSGGYDFAVMLERKSVKEISRFVFEKLATLAVNRFDLDPLHSPQIQRSSSRDGRYARR
jgi:DNA-binding Lrp family transcriptional regulator